MNEQNNSAARNAMNEFERECYDWGWADAEERIVKLLEEVSLDYPPIEDYIAKIRNQHVRAENDTFRPVLDEKEPESARSHGIDDELDYSDSITIKITKVKYLGEPSHWEFDMVNADWEDIASGTAPTFHGVLDMAIEMASNRNDLDDPEWSRFDANGGK